MSRGETEDLSWVRTQLQAIQQQRLLGGTLSRRDEKRYRALLRQEAKLLKKIAPD